MSLLIFNPNGIAIFDRATYIILGILIYLIADAVRKPTRDNISGALLAASLDSLMWWYLVAICWDNDGHLTEKFGEDFAGLAKGFPWTVPPLLMLAAIIVSKAKRRPTTVQVEPPDPPSS